MKPKKKHTKNKPPNSKVEKYMDGLRQNLLEHKMPTDAMLKDSLITVVEHAEVWIENYKALLAYKEEEVIVQAGHYMIHVKGERLRISHYMEEHMMICGNIRSIEYV